MRQEKLLQLKYGQRVDVLNPIADVLEEKLHVSLWQTSGEPDHWYACLNQTVRGYDGGDGEWGFQSVGTKWMPYNSAVHAAIILGRGLNLPVVKHDACEIVVLGMPTERSKERQRDEVLMLRRRERGTITENYLEKLAGSR